MKRFFILAGLLLIIAGCGGGGDFKLFPDGRQPNDFSFVTQNDVAPDTYVYSSTATISGNTDLTTMTVSNGEWTVITSTIDISTTSKKAALAWSSGSLAVKAGEPVTIMLRHKSKSASPLSDTTQVSTVDVAGKKATFTSIRQTKGVVSGQALNASVTTSNIGISGVNVKLYALDKTTLIDRTTTDSNGSFRFINVSDGKYYVLFEYGIQKFWFGNSSIPLEKYIVEVTGPYETGSINQMLDTASNGKLSGKVLKAANTPLSNVEVTLTSTTLPSAIVMNTGVDGVYSFSGLSAGNYTVTYKYLGQSQGTDSLSLTASGVLSFPDKTISLTGSGAISGTVKNAVGSPREGYTVKLYNSAKSELKSTSTTATGSYIFSGLDADKYYIKFVASSLVSGATDVWYDNTTSVTATPISVSTSEILNINGTME